MSDVTATVDLAKQSMTAGMQLITKLFLFPYDEIAVLPHYLVPPFEISKSSHKRKRTIREIKSTVTGIQRVKKYDCDEKKEKEVVSRRIEMRNASDRKQQTLIRHWHRPSPVH